MPQKRGMPKKIIKKEDGYYAEYSDGMIELLLSNEEYIEQNNLFPEDQEFLKAYDEDKLNEYLKSQGLLFTEVEFKTQFPSRTYRDL